MSGCVDKVFKALADPTRRMLLDRLFRRDGQTLGELCERLKMTRFGAMKHLRVLEAAHLITTRKVGREKVHYLNPVPVQQIADRWISKYAAGFTGALTHLQRSLEENMEKPKHVWELFIRTTPEKLWQAITDPQFTQQYFFESLVESTWKVGAPFTCKSATGTLYHEGKVLEVDPPNKLVHTFAAKFNPEHKNDRPSRVTWTIEKQGPICKLTLVHDDFDAETSTFQAVAKGWPGVLSGLKTLLETGEPLGLTKAS